MQFDPLANLFFAYCESCFGWKEFLFNFSRVDLLMIKTRKTGEGLGRSTKRGSFHKRLKPQAPTPQAPIRNLQTRKVANAKGLNRNTNLT